MGKCCYCSKVIKNNPYIDNIDMEFCDKDCCNCWHRDLENPTTKNGFSLIEDNPDDLILYRLGKPILKISIPEKSTQWNTDLP